MEIEHVLENHKRITERLFSVIERESQIIPTQSTPILLAIIEGKIDVLRSLGICIKTVAELEAKLAACKAEIERVSA